MQIKQLSLFPSDERFNENEFVPYVESIELPDLISQSITEAFNIVYQFQPVTERRVKSDMMNTILFSILKNKLLERGIITTNDCIDSTSGNVKKHFYVGNYIFVLCKEGSTKNDTKVTQAIEAQICDKIVIQINYTIDNTWSNLLGIRFIYSEAKSTLFSYDIPLSDYTYSNGSTLNIEVDMPKVSIKGTEKNVVNE